MCPLLETIRVTEHGAENLQYHQVRMDEAFAEFFGKANPFRLEHICGNLKAPETQIIKCRVLYSAENYHLQTSAYQPAVRASLKLVHADHLDYHLKYADRSDLNDLTRQKGNCDDILIVKHGLITDTSYANIAFLRNGQWITPETPLLKGTQRQYLLDREIISSGNISPDDLHQFESFRIFNAMLPFHQQKSLSMENIRW